jgi:hypothetical protein
LVLLGAAEPTTCLGLAASAGERAQLISATKRIAAEVIDRGQRKRLGVQRFVALVPLGPAVVYLMPAHARLRRHAAYT